MGKKAAGVTCSAKHPELTHEEVLSENEDTTVELKQPTQMDRYWARSECD